MKTNLDLVKQEAEQAGRQLVFLDAETGLMEVDAEHPGVRLWTGIEGHIVVAEYLAGFGLSELMLLFNAVSGGLLYCLWLLVLLFHYGWYASNTPYRRVLAAFMIIPILRVLSLTMPLPEVSPIFWYALVGVPVAIAVFPIAQLLNLSRLELGLRAHQWMAQILFTALGIPLAMTAYWVQPGPPIIMSGDWLTISVGALILLACAGFAQELVFRGLIQGVLRECFGSTTAILYTTLLFALMYLGVGSVEYIGFAICLSFFLGWWRDYSGSIWGGALAHGLMNTWLLVILPLVATPGAV